MIRNMQLLLYAKYHILSGETEPVGKIQRIRH